MKYYNPNEAYSVGYYYINELLPKELHEKWKGWTIDGVVTHYPELIKEYDLEDKILVPILEKKLKEMLNELGVQVGDKKV